MRDRTSAFNTAVFIPSPHLSDAVNGRIVQSEIEGGVHLRDLTPGTVLEVRTQNRAYTIQYRGSGQALISGHPVFCPEPVLVNIHGSTWGGSMLKERYIGRGMHLEFCHPEYRTPIVTSRIQEVRERIHLAFEESSSADNSPLSSAPPLPEESAPPLSVLKRGTFIKPS